MTIAISTELHYLLKQNMQPEIYKNHVKNISAKHDSHKYIYIFMYKRSLSHISNN